MAKGRRFQISDGHLTVFVDRLRLGRWDDLGRAYLTVGAEDADAIEPLCGPVVFDIPKNAAKAYRRAAEAFNAVMDEHEREHADHLRRRRDRGRPTHPRHGFAAHQPDGAAS